LINNKKGEQLVMRNSPSTDFISIGIILL